MKRKNIYDPPFPFNPDARPGLHDAISKEYTQYCTDHPNSTQEQRREAYLAIYKELQVRYPSYKEIAELGDV